MKTTFPLPEVCPSCGEPVRLDDKGVSLWCKNPACPAKLEERVLHWIKRLDILGIGPAAVQSLCSYGLIKDISDLYYLTPQKVAHCISGDTMPGRIVELILEKNEIPLRQFLSALGINNLGRTTSKLVAQEFKSLENIHESLISNQMEPRLCNLEGIGGTVASDIIKGLNVMWSTIERVIECIDVLPVENKSGPLAGKSFCMTGSLPSGTKRDDMAKRIEAAGGEVKSSVGRGLSFLIMADPTSNSSKAVKARKLGTECISEEQLVEMMG
jgi:DNA ligase (NAD+)